MLVLADDDWFLRDTGFRASYGWLGAACQATRVEGSSVKPRVLVTGPSAHRQLRAAMWITMSTVRSIVLTAVGLRFDGLVRLPPGDRGRAQRAQRSLVSRAIRARTSRTTG